MEADTFSWKDRCNRYFSSLSDTSKDGDQEKDDRQGPDSRHERPTGDEGDWRDLGEVKKTVVGSRLDRYLRKTLGALSVHGARFAAKTRHSVELIVWIFLTVIAVVVVLGLVFFIVKEYRKSKDTFTVTKVSTLSDQSLSIDNVAVSICNMNILRKSRIVGTRFDYLSELEGSNSVPYSKESNASDLRSIIYSNEKLMSLLSTEPESSVNNILEQLNATADIQEVLARSNVTVDHRLGQQGRWDMIRRRILPATTEVEKLGHQESDMVVDCRIGDRTCKESEKLPFSDARYGNCFTVIPEDPVSSISLLLDAQSGEYLHSVAPAVGFLVAVHRVDHAPRHFLTAEVNRETHIRITEETTIVREMSCQTTGDSHQCLLECQDGHLSGLCGCRQLAQDRQQACNRDDQQQYVCLRLVNLLQEQGKLSCECLENCRDIILKTETTDIVWPTEQNMHRVKTYIGQKGKHMNETEIRHGFLKIIVDIHPGSRVALEQNHQKSVLELLAHVGGLSALVLGLSAVALLEIAWTLSRAGVDFVRYLCNRSVHDGSRQRLTDSEITSITWAIYRQKRLHEERQHEADRANQRRPTTIGGNVPSRLHRRSSTGSRSREDLDQFELRKSGNEYASMESIPDKHKPEHANNKVKDRNGYRKYSHYNNYNNGRLKSISEDTQYENFKNRSENAINGVPESSLYKGSGHGGHPGSDRDTALRPVYSQRPAYVQPLPVEGVRLYGGTTAYFHSHTEPTYL